MVHFDPNEFERPYYFCTKRHSDDQGKFIKDPRINPFSVGKRDCLVFSVMCNESSLANVVPPMVEDCPAKSTQVFFHQEMTENKITNSSSSGDDYSEDDSESEDEEWTEQQRRIGKLADILDFPHIGDAEFIIDTHRKDKNRLRDFVKIKKVFKKHNTFKRWREREIMSEPQQRLRTVVLKRAKFCEQVAYDRKVMIKNALRRQEEEMEEEPVEKAVVPRSVEMKINGIVHKEYPNLCDSLKIILTNFWNPSRLRESQKCLKKKISFPVKIYRSQQSEPQRILKTRILRAAEHYKKYADYKKEDLKFKWMTGRLN